MGHNADSFRAINAADGTPRWEVPTRYFNFASAVPSHDGSTVYVLLNGRLCALDTTYGTLQWEFIGVDSSVALSPDGRTTCTWGYPWTRVSTRRLSVYALLAAPPPPPPTPAKSEW